MFPKVSRRAWHVLSGLVCMAVLGGCASSDGPPQVRDVSGDSLTTPPRLEAPDATSSEPESPLLPSAFFADGAEAFVSWRCTPAQDLISASPGDNLRLWSGQGYYALERSVVAEGKRYRKGTLTFAQQGDEAHVESDNGQLACQQEARREATTRAQAPNVIFKGQGNEPGWTLALARKAPRLTLVTQYGEQQRTLDYRVTQLENGHQASMTLEAGDAGSPIIIELEARACFDSMSGKPYPVRVRVEEDGRTLLGCGQGVERSH
ncbi:putative membrane protein [Chromohalobacter marismortui]|uniref:Putative membrane protein n=1 Tax=Chromohalobacter marismortui TaxID=42055 RepID=A0A4R7NSD5_9GAMM|nr:MULTISPECIES: C-type lysozyme, inhibitor [Chromohalobacter]MCI0509163.1 C-type lysozyme, inhibitor [Chromohalobacter sp.]MCI0592039.1 C-type lysozyme, inhibitor [Chromohalobacter sp.]TDU23944.1 putative membrane protein [Chromohalobacter marismortui]